MKKTNTEKEIREYCEKLDNNFRNRFYHYPHVESEKLFEMLDNSDIGYNSDLWVEIEDLIFDTTEIFNQM